MLVEKRTRIFIVDDHELVRTGLKAVLKDQTAIKVVGEAGSYEGLLRSLRTGRADIVILDITLPDRNGLDALKNIKNQFPDMKVLILSMHPEERFAVRALRAGAAGYLNKQMAATELVKAIERIGKGGRYVSPELAEQLASEIGHKVTSRPHKQLTDREFEIFRLVATGKTSSKIARELSLSVNTITTYRMRILKKMKMKNNADVVRYALEHNLID